MSGDLSAASADASGSTDLDSAGAQITIDATMKDFLSVPVGVDGAAATFKISNAGGASTGALVVTIMGGDFTKPSDDCNGNILAAGGFCTIEIVFAPTAVGALSGTLTVTGTPGGSAEAALTGTGLAASSLKVMPGSYAFGDVRIGQTASTQMTLHNAGSSSAGTITLSLTGSDATQFALVSDLCSDTTLAAGATCTVTVKFAPTTRGSSSAALTITAKSAPSTSATLTGVGQTPAALTMSPASKDFGSQGTGTKPTTTFTVTNTGDVATGACAASITGDSSFTVTNNGCSAGVVPGTPCMVTVQFSPTTQGAKVGAVAVGDGVVSKSAQLMGTGAAPAHLNITPTTHSYQFQKDGQTLDYALTIGNDGGVTSSALTSMIAAPFAVLSTTCPSTGVVAGSTCTITVRWTAVDGYDQSVLSVTATSGGTVTSTLSGNGVTTCAASSASQLQYVDPTYGTNDTAHGAGYGGCAYKTLTYALTQATGQVALFSGTYTPTTETFPIKLTGAQQLDCNFETSPPATLKGKGLAAGTGQSVTLWYNGSSNATYSCTIDGGGGTGGACVYIDGTPSAGHYVSEGTISNCGGYGILATVGVNVGNVTFAGTSSGGISFTGSNPTAAMSNNVFSESGTTDISCSAADDNVDGSGNAHAGGATRCSTCARCPF